MLSSLLASWRWGEGEALGPGIFSGFHFVWVAIWIAACVVAGLAARRRRDPKTDDKVILVISIVLIVMETLKHVMYDIGYYHYLRFDIMPLSFCAMPLFIAFIGAVTKNAKVKETCYKFLAFFGIIGGIASMVYPVSLETFFVYTSFHTMIWHILLCVMGVYLIVARGYGKAFKKELFAPALLFICLAIGAAALNEVAYFGYLKPAGTPVYETEYMPGSYEYYKYGFEDGENDCYKLLSDGGDALTLTEAYADSASVVLTLQDGSDSTFDLWYTANDGETRYIVIEDRDGVQTPELSYEPSTAWEFDYSGTHPVLVAKVGDAAYTLDFANGNATAVVFTPSSAIREAYFIKATVEREGDSANFFFISNHSLTPIPVLSAVQDACPYPVFILAYIASFLLLSSGIFGCVYAIRKKKSAQ